MGKLTSFATGMGEGYLAGKRYKDNKARQERQDAIMEKVLAADSSTAAPAAAPAEEEEKPLWKRMFGMKDGGAVRGYANGGMIGDNTPMPSHSCKMSWQRQSFKK
jgi:hypothetical protein